jgi:hypothetical protein
MQVWTCYIISMPSGRLVANHNRNQCITSTLGWRKFTVNKYHVGKPVNETGSISSVLARGDSRESVSPLRPWARQVWNGWGGLLPPQKECCSSLHVRAAAGSHGRVPTFSPPLPRTMRRRIIEPDKLTEQAGGTSAPAIERCRGERAVHVEAGAVGGHRHDSW